MKISFMDKDMDELTQIDVRDVDYIYAVNSDVGDVINLRRKPTCLRVG